MKIIFTLLFYLLFVNLLLSQTDSKKIYPPFSKKDMNKIISDIDLGIGYLILIKSKKEKKSYHLVNTIWFSPILEKKLDKAKIKKMLKKGIVEDSESYISISKSNIKLFEDWSDCKLIKSVFEKEILTEKELNYFESKPIRLAALIKRNFVMGVSDFDGDLILLNYKKHVNCWE